MHSWIHQLYRYLYQIHDWLPIGIGIVATLLLLIVIRQLWNRRGGSQLVAKNWNHITEEAVNWLPREQNPIDRRSSPRREGPPTPIFVWDIRGRSKQLEAYVLDRSTGGLKIAVQKQFSVGTPLMVRAQNAPSESPWVKVMVRNIKAVGDYHEIGVQFAEAPLPWNILLLFG